MVLQARASTRGALPPSARVSSGRTSKAKRIATRFIVQRKPAQQRYVGGIALDSDASKNLAIQRVQRGLRQHVKAGKLPGLAGAVYVDGSLRLLEEAGFADVERSIPMTDKSIVRLYSMTKPLIAVVVQQLVDEKRLGLDDLLSDYIPGFKDVKVIKEGDDGLPNWDELVKPKQPIRIRHLLTHTSGISSGLASGIDGPKKRSARERAWAAIYAPLVRGVDEGQISSLAQWTDELAKLPLFEHPGVHYEYGFGYDVLGRIVELVTGGKLADELHRRIFKPLGMRDTFFDFQGLSKSVRAPAMTRLSVLYRRTKSTLFGGDGASKQFIRVDPLPHKATLWAARCQVPSGGGAVSSLAGGCLSTLDDYAKLLLTVVSGGAHPATGVRILSAGAAKRMLADQTAELGPRTPVGASPYDDRGLGLSCIGELQRRGAPSWGRWFDGVEGVRLWGGAASTAFKYDPNGGRPILAIVMTQVLPQEDGTAVSELLKGMRAATGPGPARRGRGRGGSSGGGAAKRTRRS